MKLVIALTGKSKSGKDYLCTKLLSYLKGKCSRYAFADSLKALYAERQNITLNDLELNKELHRQNLIDLSEKELKVKDKAYFGRNFCNYIDKKINGLDVVILSDMRYHAELFFTEGYLAAKQIPFFLVGVKRNEIPEIFCGWCLDDVLPHHVFNNNSDENLFNLEFETLLSILQKEYGVGNFYLER